jgi:charged multivesicular body protein 7
LDVKINELRKATQNAVNNKNRILALSTLRSKKVAERNLKQRSDTLIQLEEVYIKIEQAADQVDILRVMEASTGVLRALHAQVGGVEKVVDIVEELREEMAKVDEVGNVITEAGPVIDEGELDDELLAMESQERQVLEAIEAEDTKRRLAELEGLEGVEIKASLEAAQSQSITKILRPACSTPDLDANINRLSRMSIEDSPQNGDSQGKGSRPVAEE